MNTRKWILATVVLFVLSNVLTTTWYMITDEANFVTFRRPEVNYLGLMINHLVFVIGFIYLIHLLLQVKPGISSAFGFGMILAGIMFVPSGIVVRSIWQVEFNLFFYLNALAHLVIGGILGVGFQMIHRYGAAG